MQGQAYNFDYTKFCAIGAIDAAGGGLEAEAAIKDLVPACHKGSVIRFNDAARRRKKDVVGLFTKAIRKLSRKK